MRLPTPKQLIPVIFLITFALLVCALPKKISAQNSTTTLGPWQETTAFVDTAHRSHPLPSFAIGQYYYVHTKKEESGSKEDRILYFAQQQTNGSLSAWSVAINDHGGGPQGYTAVAAENTAYHFRNGHIAQYIVNPSNGTISEIKLLENAGANNAFSGNRYMWDTAVYVPFIHAYKYIYHFGGFDMVSHSYNSNFLHRAVVPLPESNAVFNKISTLNVPTNNPSKAAFFKAAPDSDRGFIYMGVRNSSKLYRIRVIEDIASVPNEFIDSGDLPNGTGNNLGDLFVIGNSLFTVRGKKVFQATINANDGSLSAWNDAPPDLPEDQVDINWGADNTEGASYGIIGNYIYLTGPKKVYYARINPDSSEPTITQSPTATPTTPAFTGDANNDGKVNILDFEILRQEYLREGANLRADFNNDNKVNSDDLKILKDTFAI